MDILHARHCFTTVIINAAHKRSIARTGTNAFASTKNKFLSQSYPTLRRSHQSPLCGDACISVLDQHPRVFPKPLTSPWSPLQTTLTVALSAGLDPDDTVDERIANGCTRLYAKTSGSHIAPFTLEKVSTLVAQEMTIKTIQKDLKPMPTLGRRYQEMGDKPIQLSHLARPHGLGR